MQFPLAYAFARFLSLSRFLVFPFLCHHAHGAQSKFTIEQRKNIHLVFESRAHSWTPQFHHRFSNGVTQMKWLLFFSCVCVCVLWLPLCQMLLGVFHLNFILIVVCPFWHFTLAWIGCLFVCYTFCYLLFFSGFSILSKRKCSFFSLALPLNFALTLWKTSFCTDKNFFVSTFPFRVELHNMNIISLRKYTLLHGKITVVKFNVVPSTYLFGKSLRECCA